MIPDHPDSARVESTQISIFARDSRTVCAELRFPWIEAQRLHGEQWLSFDPETAGPLDESREAELIFVASLVAGGCGRPMLRQLLQDLSKPYCYDGRRIFYGWHDQRWHLLPGEGDPEEAFFALLGRLRDRREREVLLNIREWADEALDLARDRTHVFMHTGSGYSAHARFVPARAADHDANER